MKKVLFLSLCFGLLVIGCKAPGNYGNDPAEDYIDSTTVLSLNYWQIEEPGDLSYDTLGGEVNATISRALLDSLGGEIKPYNILTIWANTVQSPVFMRVETVEHKDGKVFLTGPKTDFSEALGDIDLTFNTQPYYNPTPPAATRSAAEDMDINPQLVSSLGELHPTFIEVAPSEILDSATLELYDGNLVTSPDHLLSNPNNIFLDMANFHEQPAFTKLSGGVDFCLGASVKIEKEFKNESTSQLTAASLKLAGSAAAKLGVKLGIETKRFSIKKFYASVYGTYNTTLEATAKMKVAKVLGDQDYVDIGTFSGYRAVFFVGPIPVEIKVGPQIQRKVALTIGGDISYTVKTGIKGSFEKGMKWENGKWTDISNSTKETITPTFNIQDIQASISAKLEAGIYFKGDIKLYELAGPYFRLGPKLTTDATLTLKDDPSTGAGVEAKVEGHAKLTGSIGAEIKVWRWTLAKVESSIDLFDYKFWDWSDFYQLP